jgi:hypothetical protein
MAKNAVEFSIRINEEQKTPRMLTKGGDHAIGIIATETGSMIETEGFVLGKLDKEDLIRAHIRISEILAEAISEEMEVPKEVVLLSLGETLTRHGKREMEKAKKPSPEEALKMVFSLLK